MVLAIDPRATQNRVRNRLYALARQVDENPSFAHTIEFRNSIDRLLLSLDTSPRIPWSSELHHELFDVRGDGFSYVMDPCRGFPRLSHLAVVIDRKDVKGNSFAEKLDEGELLDYDYVVLTGRSYPVGAIVAYVPQRFGDTVVFSTKHTPAGFGVGRALIDQDQSLLIGFLPDKPTKGSLIDQVDFRSVVSLPTEDIPSLLIPAQRMVRANLSCKSAGSGLEYALTLAQAVGSGHLADREVVRTFVRRFRQGYDYTADF